MKQPVKPKLSDYGLTDDDFRSLEEMERAKVEYLECLDFRKYKKIYDWRILCAFQIFSFLLVVFGLGLLFEHGRDDACLGSFCFVFGLFALRHWFKIDDAEEAYLKAHFIKVSLLRNECAKLEKSLAGSKSKTLEKYQNDHENYLSAQRDWEHFETRKQKALARKEKDYWLKMDGLKFEKEFASLLRRNGFSAKATKPSGDEGIDIVGTLEGEPLVVQCKAWKNPVGAPDMRNFLGSWDHHNGKKGKAWLVGLSGFNAGARKVAKKAGIKLIDVDDVIELAESAQ